jgi:hypothetical protein
MTNCRNVNIYDNKCRGYGQYKFDEYNVDIQVHMISPKTEIDELRNNARAVPDQASCPDLDPTVCFAPHRDLPIRLTTKEVCQLGRFSAVTLWRRRRAGLLPPPIDRGREALFDRDAVLAVLRPSLPSPPTPTKESAWRADPNAIRNPRPR